MNLTMSLYNRSSIYQVKPMPSDPRFASDDYIFRIFVSSA